MLANPIISVVTLLIFGLLFSLMMQARNANVVRNVCLGVSLLALAFGIDAALVFDKTSVGYQFTNYFNLIPRLNFTLSLGVDGLSLVFLLLTLIVFPALFLSAWSVSQASKQFFCHLIAMEILLVLTFVTTDLFYFFVLFESLLIPMFILIGVWGARTRKVKAAYYFFLYTLFGSLFMLFGMIYLYHITGSLNYYVLLNFPFDLIDQKIIWLCFFLALAIKMPLFPFHIWLPEAHVEAPTVGSMLLASLLLKLGGYGFLRFSLTFLSAASEVYFPLVVAISVAGVIYGSLSTLRQIDLKRIVAYSSVSHMNLVALGLFSFKQEGLAGATYLMVAHGVVSAALFFCVGVLYDRTHSRLVRYYGGLVTTMPLLAVAFFVFSLANMSFPGTPNFLGELLMFVGIFTRSILVLFLSTPGIILAAAFSVFLFNRVFFGTIKSKYVTEFSDANRVENAVIYVLIVLTVVLGIVSNIVLDYTHVVLRTIELLYVSSGLDVSPFAVFDLGNL